MLRVLGAKVTARIGVTEEERASPRELDLDLEIKIHTRLAAATDDIGATIDYARAADAAAATLASREFRLLETAAEAVAEAVLALGARRVTVRLGKGTPPMAVRAARAEIEITRP